MTSYLGDGLYAKDEGFHVSLSTNDENVVYLDDHVLFNFLKFIETTRKIRITIENHKDAS